MIFFRNKSDIPARGEVGFIVAGLGNPGSRYEWTRHNFGFLVIDAILAELRKAEKHTKAGKLRVPKTPRYLWNAEVYFVQIPVDFAGVLINRGSLQGFAGTGEATEKPCESSTAAVVSLKKNLILMKPQTFMNLSGRAVARAVSAYPEARLLVICDDVNLPWGEIRLRARGSSGGHKGLESVISELGTSDFARIRIGVGGGELPDVTEFVLQPMNELERKQAKELARLAGQKAIEIVFLGFEKASATKVHYEGE